jgi:hypothetical protein
LDFIERAGGAGSFRRRTPGQSAAHPRAKPGPIFQLGRRMEQVKLLPHKKQQLVIEFLDAIISTEKA